MSARFTAAPSYFWNYAQQHPFAQAYYPFSVGMWVYLTTDGGGSGRSIFDMGADTGANGMGCAVAPTGEGSPFRVLSGASSVYTAANGATTVPLNAWHYIVGRFISTTNRRMTVLFDSGLIEEIQDTTSSNPTTPVTFLQLGIRGSSGTNPNDWFNGMIAEFWYTNEDIQPGGAALDAALMRQLAYGGPFSVPNVKRGLLEYHSLRATPNSNNPVAMSGDEVYSRIGVKFWRAEALSVAPHPPLPISYERIRQRRMILPV